MGNSYLCGSKSCVQPRPVHKTILNNLFKVNFEKKTEESASGSNSGNIEEINKDYSKNSKTEFQNLENHVKTHVKGLIDYLETNHKVVAECGEQIFKRMQSAISIEIHIVGLMIFTELLLESKKFTHDKTFLSRLVLQKKDTLTKQDINEKEKDHDNNSFIETITEGIIVFEGNAIDAMNFVISNKKYKSSSVPNDKIELVLNDILEIISSYQDLESKENLELHSILLEIMAVLTNSPTLIFKFKNKFIDYSFNLLKKLYDLNEKQSPDENKLREKIISSSLDLFVDVCQTVFDLNELTTLISPVMVLLDSTKWSQERLHTDLILSLTRSKKASSTIEHIEIFLIKKIIQYLEYKPSLQFQSFKNNEDIDVILRVFNLLEKIFDEITTPLFLFMINEMICNCFLSKLDLIIKAQSSREIAEKALYRSFKCFLEKINSLPKNSFQIINNILVDLLNKSLKQQKDNISIKETFKFLFFTLDYIGTMPLDIPIPKDLIAILIKLSENFEYEDNAFKAIEILTNLKYTNDSQSSNSKIDYITIQPNVIYIFIKNCLTRIKKYIELARPAGLEKEFEMYSYLKKITKINRLLLARRDLKYLKVLVPFFKKLIDLIDNDDLDESIKGLIILFVLGFLDQTYKIWKVEGFDSKIESLKKTIPQECSKVWNDETDIGKGDLQNIFNLFNKISFMNSVKRNIEFEAFINLLSIHIRKLEPYVNYSDLNDDFEEIEQVFSSTPGYTEEPPSFIEQNKGGDHNGSIIRFFEPYSSPNEKTLMKKDSMGPFDQYQYSANQDVIRPENINQILNPNPIMIDDSFEKAMNELKNSKTKNNNILKIIETKI